MPEPEIERSRNTERTTIIHTDGGGGGNGGLIAVVVVLILLAALLFFLFGSSLGGESADRDVNVNIDAPTIEVPDVNVDVAPGQPAEGGGDTNSAE